MSNSRKIFEEVTSGDQKPSPKAGMIERGSGARGAIRIWLALLFLLVALMVVVGGLTRLTDSGLSITEWKPVVGAIPPLDEAHWQEEFEKYQQIPEYKLQNYHMDLAEFKTIYWWEWGHRQLGRFIGLVWAIGFFGFLLARKIPAGWTGRLALLGALGGLQGAIGWWMVSSGLSGDRLDVASYRLATHLGLAFLILGVISWQFLTLGRSQSALVTARRQGQKHMIILSNILIVMIFVQILLGALVAGIDAGRTFVDWPYMDGQFFPPNAFDLQPFWRNLFENAGLTQFMHRMMAYSIAVVALITALRARDLGHDWMRQSFYLLSLVIFAQATLGIFTVLAASPLDLAITHQIGAILTFVLAIHAGFLARYPSEQRIGATK